MLPAGLAGFVFSKPHNGSHRALAAVTSVLAVAEVGSIQRIAIDRSNDAQLPRRSSSILVCVGDRICAHNSSDPVQSEYSCRKEWALGSILRILHSLASC